MTIGSIYYWGQGAAIDYPRAMAAYKVGAEGGHAACQFAVSMMYKGCGVDKDDKQALLWLEKAAAQDDPDAVGRLGVMYADGEVVAPSFRRAREYYERAIELGNSTAVENMQTLTQSIPNVTSERSNHCTPSFITHARPHVLPPHLAITGRPPHGPAGRDP